MKKDQQQYEYVTALAIENINTPHKEELADVIIAAANWAKQMGNDRISVTFILKFSKNPKRKNPKNE